MLNLDSINLGGTQRRAVMKLAVELVKADDRIHSKEVAVLDELQSMLGLEQEELDLIHYLSLENAVECLNDLDEDSTERVTGLFKDIMCSDTTSTSRRIFCCPQSQCLATADPETGAGYCPRTQPNPKRLKSKSSFLKAKLRKRRIWFSMTNTTTYSFKGIRRHRNRVFLPSGHYSRVRATS